MLCVIRELFSLLLLMICFLFFFGKFGTGAQLGKALRKDSILSDKKCSSRPTFLIKSYLTLFSLFFFVKKIQKHHTQIGSRFIFPSDFGHEAQNRLQNS